MISSLWVLILLAQQATGQCVFVNLSGPKCTSDGFISGTFSRNPYQIDWQLNGTSINKTTVTWTTLAVTPVSGKVNGSTIQNKLAGFAGGIAVDNDGSILVSDTLNNRIVSFNKNNPDGITVAGGNGKGFAANQLNKPAGIFLDSFGNLFVADSYNNRILRFAPGSNTGFLVAGGNGAGSGANQLNNPKDIFVDGSGYVFIADAGNHRIQKWPQGGGIGVTVAGGNGAGKDSSQLNSPQSVCVDQAGNIYVADSANHRIQKFIPGQNYGVSVAGGYGAGAALGQLFRPVDVQVDAEQNIYILDESNHRVQRWTSTFGVTTMAGNLNGIGGSGADFLQNPSAFSFDASGNLFVLDQDNARIQQFSINPLTTVLVPVKGGRYTADAYSFLGCKQSSNVVTVIENPLLKFSGNTQICKGDTAEIKISGGGGRYTWLPANSVIKVTDSIYRLKPDSTTYYGITAVNDSGCVSFASVTITVGARVFPVITATNCATPASSKLTASLNGGVPANLMWYSEGVLMGGSFPSWLANATAIAGGNGTGNAAAQLNLPSGVFVDAKSNIYVADAVNHRIQLWKAGELVGTTVAGGNGPGNGTDQLNYPTGVFVDVNGNIYVADQNNHRIQLFNAGSTKGVTVAGNGTAGNSFFQLNFPTSVFVDAYGNVYVADAGNHRIQKWVSGARSVTTVAGSAIGMPGSSNSNLSNPQGLFVDKNENVYVADAGNHRIMFFLKDSVKFGIPFAGGRGVGTASNQLNAPAGIVVDAYANMYIVDRGNNRIQRWKAFDSTGVTIAGNANGSGGSGQNQLQFPTALAFSNKGALYVADARNNRVQQFTLVNSIDTVLYTSIEGKYSAIATTFSGCNTGSSFDTLKVAPAINIVADATTICEGATTTLRATGSSRYIWSPATGLSSNTDSVVAASPAVTTKYTITNTALNGCATNSSITLKVNKRPIVGINGLNCIGGGNLTVSSFPNPMSAQWYNNNSPIKAYGPSWRKAAATIAGTSIGGTDSSKLARPTFVFVTDQGVLYIVDQWNQRVQKWEQGATAGVTVAGGKGAGSNANQLKNPTGIFVDTKGVLYIADTENDRIQKWMPGDTAGVTVAGGNGRGSNADQLSYPTGVYLDAYDNIYIADAINARVQKWSPGSSKGITVAGGNFAGPAMNQLNSPFGVFVDGSGNIYIADAQNDRIQRWAPNALVGVTVAGGNGRGNNANQLVQPMSVFVDGANNIYVAEGSTAHRIKKFVLGVNNGEVIAGGASSGNTPDLLNSPGNAVLDSRGNLFVSDMSNFRVQRFALADTTMPVTPDSTGSYGLTVTSFGGCTVDATPLVMRTGTIPSAPIVTNKKYCINDTPTPLTATGKNLLWYSVEAGGVGDTIAPKPSTTSAGSYNFWVSQIDSLKTCESRRAKIDVNVFAYPGARIAVTPKANLLPGDTAFIAAKPDTGKLATKYLWYKNGVFQSTIADSIKTLQVYYNGVGKYYAELTDSNFCISKSNEIEIRGDLAPQEQMYMFPNPARTTTRLIFAAVPNNVTYLKVISPNGLVVMSQKLNTAASGNTIFELDISSFVNGIYDVQIVTGLGKIIGVKRLIKL
ncbi:MAG: T9SS type A sorting domain-containing protein [Sediminibacterium sp.]|nr:T9SS type A sorting domain-containing protein [Sediminibacterium sp.]